MESDSALIVRKHEFFSFDSVAYSEEGKIGFFNPKNESPIPLGVMGKSKKEKEMKLIRGLVVAIAAMSFATVAQAATAVWFSATPVGPGAGVGASGPGLALELTSNPGLGESSWNVIAHMSTDEGLFAYDISVVSNDAGLTGSGAAALGGDFGAATDVVSNGTSPGTVARVGQTDTGTTPNNNGADISLFSFLLTYAGNSDASLDAGTADDSFGWGDENFGFGNITYGADPVVREGLGGPDAFGGPVINITNIPEPATLTLLGLGVVALVRRRR